ncbi:MAG: TonB-dependent siderophore receptor [Burkholderiales bacterium]|nr:TonB-dependent siderophore receptor [Burkholderiales bacterium]
MTIDFSRANCREPGAGIAASTLNPIPLKSSLIALAVMAALEVHAQAAPPPTAQEADKKDAQTLKPVIVQDKVEAQQGKDAVRAVTTPSFKGNQALRDIPQSVTVVTEKLMLERNLDTVKDVLHNTAGVTFLAAEGGEEDIRLRGFSMAQTGDIFLDGMRDAAFYDRDTFNLDRLDLLRGSASMLFGRGSTGGIANQVSKKPHLVEEKSVALTLGNHKYNRFVADINQPVAQDTAVRFTAMHTEADNNGVGTSLNKQGAALAVTHGIGLRHEFQAQLYYLDNKNGINYGLPWIRPTTASTSAENTIIGSLEPDAYYGAASDRNLGRAMIGTLGHVFRINADTELTTRVRAGEYERDMRASTVRFVGGTGAVQNTLEGFGPSTVFSRGNQLKVQNLQTTQAQSDLSTKFTAFGKTHQLLAGVDFAKDERVVFAARSAAQGGVTVPNKPTTTAGTPHDGAGVDEGSRVFRRGNDFNAEAWGVYVQDNIEITPTVKAILGLRYDSLDGRYNTYAIPTNAAGPETVTSYRQKVSEWSHRIGFLYQPSDSLSFYGSHGTSFNTSGDAYSYNALSANTPPESSENVEIGARIESFDKRLSTRVALFRSVKKNERNTDPDTAATRLLLSGKRHAQGLELDIAGRISPAWEVYFSYTWIPTAKVDDAASTVNTVGNREGDRPGLTPKHNGTVWTTYQLTPKFRFGGGINFRSKTAPADVTAPAWEAPSYTTGDLFAEYKLNQTFTFKANVTNVADKLYGDALYRGHYVPGPGRLVQGTLTVSF